MDRVVAPEYLADMLLQNPVDKHISHFSYLQCAECSKRYHPDEVNTFATCEKCAGNPLVSGYENVVGEPWELIDSGERSMWRYFPLLPVTHPDNIVSLGEGFTPLLSLKNLGRHEGLRRLSLKDESFNPTGSFKARGMSVAISRARELGIERCIVPTAGNAGGAMAAYCAKAGMEAVVVMPEHTPEVFKSECRLYGAKLILEKGLISDCARKVREINLRGEYFDLSTLKEPYRLEGKKTMGFEIAEQLDWNLPDVILYPTGGGTGLIGMWKAFHEMMKLGWIAAKLPKMIAVQSENCKPIVETWAGRQPDSRNYVGNSTIANGLAVPRPFGERMIVRTLNESNGFPVAVSETEILDAVREVARLEGMILAPEGAALWAALKSLLATHQLSPDDHVLLLSTGTGYKYLENLSGV